MGISMTLLKAIFTGRKRSKVFFILMFLSLGLSADPYRVGLVVDSKRDIPYVSTFPQMLSFAAKRIENQALIENAEKMDALREQIAYEKEIASSFRKEAEVKDAPERQRSSEYDVEVVPLEPGAEDLAFLKAGDDIAIDYIKYVNDLDELYLISVEEDDGLYEVSFSLDGLPLFRFFYSEYVDSDAEAELLNYMLLRYRTGSYALARINGNTSANIFVDGGMAERYADYLVIPFGMRHIEVASPSYETESMDVMVDSSFTELCYELTKVRTMPLFISTLPYTDDVYYQGERVSGGYVQDTTYPFSLIATKEGFESRTVQSDVGEHSVVTTLLPSALYYPERVNEKKGEMYTHLLITLLSYGASIAVDVVSDIYCLELAPVSTLMKGVSVLELVRTFTALFEYKDALGYGI